MISTRPIISHMKKTYNLTIGEQTAERIKIEIGSGAPVGEPKHDGRARSRHDLRTAAQDGRHERGDSRGAPGTAERRSSKR